MMRLLSYSLSLGAMLLSGCVCAPHTVTIEDELVQTFGSYEDACEATMTIIPNLFRKELPVELSREDRLQVLEALRGCIRYHDDDTTESKLEELRRRGLGGYLSATDNKIKIASKGKEYFVYFSDMGLLSWHLYTTPDSVALVHYTLKCCLEECKKRSKEIEKAAGESESRTVVGEGYELR